MKGVHFVDCFEFMMNIISTFKANIKFIYYEFSETATTQSTKVENIPLKNCASTIDVTFSRLPILRDYVLKLTDLKMILHTI